MKVTVLGSGAWGTALALVLVENHHQVTLWSYSEKECAAMKVTGENAMLQGVAMTTTSQSCTTPISVLRQSSSGRATP